MDSPKPWKQKKKRKKRSRNKSVSQTYTEETGISLETPPASTQPPRTSPHSLVCESSTQPPGTSPHSLVCESSTRPPGTSPHSLVCESSTQDSVPSPSVHTSQTGDVPGGCFEESNEILQTNSNTSVREANVSGTLEKDSQTLLEDHLLEDAQQLLDSEAVEDRESVVSDSCLSYISPKRPLPPEPPCSGGEMSPVVLPQHEPITNGVRQKLLNCDRKSSSTCSSGMR
jgi:hypothetical protein